MGIDHPIEYSVALSGGGRIVLGISDFRSDASGITARVRLEGDVVRVVLSRVGDAWSLEIQNPDGAVRSAGLVGLVRLERSGGAVHVSSPMGNRRATVQPIRVGRALEGFAEARAGEGGGARDVLSPIPGRVVEVQVAEGDIIEPGRCVAVIEAMKMENEVAAESAGVVAEIFVRPGQTVDGGEALIRLE